MPECLRYGHSGKVPICRDGRVTTCASPGKPQRTASSGLPQLLVGLVHPAQDRRHVVGAPPVRVMLLEPGGAADPPLVVADAVLLDVVGLRLQPGDLRGDLEGLDD